MDPSKTNLVQYINQLVMIRAQLELRILELEAKVAELTTPSPTQE